MKRDSLLYVVAGSSSVRLRFTHGIKDSTVSMMDQKFRRLCRLPISIVAFKNRIEHCYRVTARYINLETKTILTYYRIHMLHTYVINFVLSRCIRHGQSCRRQLNLHAGLIHL